MSYRSLLRLVIVAVGIASEGQAQEAHSLATAATGRPAIAVGEGTITISGAPLGATYYLVGLGRRTEGPEVTRRYFRLEGSTDSDGDGILTLEIEEGVPEDSLWAAINRSGGPILYSVPRKFPRALPRLLEDEYLTQSPSGPLLLSGEQLVVLFRREVGAWVWRGRADVVPSGDPQLPDRLLLPPTTFESLGVEDPPLDEFLPGDALFALDQRTFDLRRLVFEAEEVAR